MINIYKASLLMAPNMKIHSNELLLSVIVLIVLCRELDCVILIPVKLCKVLLVRIYILGMVFPLDFHCRFYTS